MKCYKILTCFFLTFILACGVQAQTADSVDVLDYDVSVDLSAGKPFAGDATLTVRLAAPCRSLALSLHGTADSAWVNGAALDTVDLGAIPTTAFAAGDTLTVRICYHGAGYVESYGWGGFHFDNDMTYNLGVGFNVDPHVMGSVLMPCRDNFHDKATYTLRVRAKRGWTAECGGLLQSRTIGADSLEHSVWRIGQEVPTYLVSVSQAAFRRIHSSVPALYGTYPLTLGFREGDSTLVKRAFRELDSVVPMYERCLGPYRWGRIGYIATSKGSMEHVNNIALAKEFMTSVAERGQMTIAHELGHAWFGNLVTCRTEADMWFNEGGASFCSELAMEATKGRAAAQKYYQTNLEAVVREAHVTDNGYRPLSPMPHQYTYGSTTYDKGALVWHSLRGYLGDSVFYGAMGRLMADKAFSTIDAAEVRDSLSAYTGCDLTDFFRFHVFSPGFVDYHVHMDGTDVVVRQQTIGGDAAVLSNRVPVTFFSASGDTAKRVLAFDGVEGHVAVSLPFAPLYYVLDRDCELSDAATLAVYRKGSSALNAAAHVNLYGTIAEEDSVFVEHHWGRPWDLDTLTGLRRPAGRYWVVSGARQQYAGLQLRLRYVRDGYVNGNYPYLDPGFVSSAAVDSVRVLYRQGYGHPWQAVSHQRIGNSNEGWFTVDNPRTGEYTLAVVDTNLLSIHSPLSTLHTPLSLFPNPVAAGEEITLQVPVEGTFTVRIFDAAGRQVWRKKGCANGRRVNPRLASGTYLVQIENKFVSLQSKLIVL
ncbi:MAG: T9SS type A sorting domain-containing protein [Bacteroidales bacterium]|nr:T9SS type A sorting domain-containing protein [Bacteroidales bacterium]